MITVVLISEIMMNCVNNGAKERVERSLARRVQKTQQWRRSLYSLELTAKNKKKSRQRN